MSNPVIFKELPATFPEADRFRKPSIVSSLVVHVTLILALIIIPMSIRERINDWELLTTLVSPLGPPPAAPPPPPMGVAAAPEPEVVKAPSTTVDPGAIIMPTAIPREIAQIVDDPISPDIGVVGGVPGGVPGGVAGGILASLLSRSVPAAQVLAAPPPPPPPPPPPVPAPAITGPVRVGGNIQEPRVIKAVPPVYPPLASKARVSGTVVLEATLTARGTVEAITVVSGHPLLVQAAVDAVRKWQYEPTYLNSVAVPVILTARVVFNQRPTR